MKGYCKIYTKKKIIIINLHFNHIIDKSYAEMSYKGKKFFNSEEENFCLLISQCYLAHLATLT